MCLNLLGELSETRLPCTKADSAMIDRLRLLEAAGLIKVLIPPAHVDCDHCLRQDPATVLDITPRGWEILRTNMVEDDVPLPASRPRRPRSSSAALDLAQLAAWFNSSRGPLRRLMPPPQRATGRPDTDD